jgi:hypothetical protein
VQERERKRVRERDPNVRHGAQGASVSSPPIASNVSRRTAIVEPKQ